MHEVSHGRADRRACVSDRLESIFVVGFRIPVREVFASTSPDLEDDLRELSSDPSAVGVRFVVVGAGYCDGSPCFGHRWQSVWRAEQRPAVDAARPVCHVPYSAEGG